MWGYFVRPWLAERAKPLDGSRDANRPRRVRPRPVGPLEPGAPEPVVAREYVGSGLDGAGMIVFGHILCCQATQLSLAQDDDAIEAFATDTAQQPFTDSIGPWCSQRHIQFTEARPCCHVGKTQTVLVVVVAD